MELIIKLILSHILTDFFLQPNKWVAHKKKYRWKSGYLYLHGLITAAAVYVILWEVNKWPIAVIIGISHTLIDAIKLQFNDTGKSFLIDQLAHLLVILVTSVYFIPLEWDYLLKAPDKNQLLLVTAYLAVSFPAGILIGKLTANWQTKAGSNGLKDAGKWIGITERILILTLVLLQQYTAIGFIIAAKSVLRYASDQEKSLAHSEYVIVGTLISFSIAIFTGLLLQYLIDFTAF